MPAQRLKMSVWINFILVTTAELTTNGYASGTPMLLFRLLIANEIGAQLW